MQKSMLLISSRRDNAPTFRLIPVINDTPFLEGIYIPQASAMVLFYKHQVDGFHMLPTLDSNGDPVRSVKGSKNAGGESYKQERKMLKTAHEVYLSDKKEIEDFVNMFAVNAADFDYKKFMVAPSIIKPATGQSTEESPKIILNS